MVLNNLKKLFMRYSSNTVAPKNVNGSEVNFVIAGPNAMYALTGYNISYAIMGLTQGMSSIDVGFGDTSENADDYILADGNATSQKLTVIADGKNFPALGEIRNSYVNFRNNTNENVIVKEIGIYGNPNTSGSSSGSNTVLMFRKVLDNPITIAPGETYSFNYIVKFKDA